MVARTVASEAYHDWSGEAAGARLCVNFTLKLLLSQNFCNRPLMRFISFASNIGPTAVYLRDRLRRPCRNPPSLSNCLAYYGSVVQYLCTYPLHCFFTCNNYTEQKQSAHIQITRPYKPWKSNFYLS